MSLTEQGYDPVPAALLDWLKAIDDLVHEPQMPAEDEQPEGVRE